jgi:acetylornithine deacetylase/succinyl-diaminopimelate desuccinylase-like protein
LVFVWKIEIGDTMLDKALEYAHQNREGFLSQLKEFLAIPTISTLDERKPDMQRGAEWVAAQLRSLHMDNVQIMPTAGHPVVFAEWLGAGKSAPTVMIWTL